MRRIIELSLLIAVVIGGFLAWRSGRERARLRTDYDRLTRTVGDLTIGDASKLHLRAVETGGPLHFAWHLYLPPNYLLVVKTASGGSSSTVSSEPRDFIARVRFREDDAGRLQVHTSFGSSSGRSSLGDRPLADLLRGRWSGILVERPGVAETAVIEPGKPTVLLRLTLPEDLREAARGILPVRPREGEPLVLYEIILNPDPSKL